MPAFDMLSTWCSKRSFLLTCNLLLLSTVMPAVGHSQYHSQDDSQDDSLHTVEQEEAEKDKHPETGGEVAGAVVGACCAAVIGGAIESAVHDASDVDQRAHESKEPNGREPSSESWTRRRVPFNAKAAKMALEKARQQVEEECVTADEHLQHHKLTVTFLPGGKGDDARLEPPPASERLDKCARSAFERARVPRFAGKAITVTMSVEGSADAPEAGSGGSGGH